MRHDRPHDMPTRKAWRKKYGKHSTGRQALLAELDTALADVDRLVVKVGGSVDAVLFESRAAEDIRSLQDCLVLEPSRRVIDCICSGSPVVELFGADRLVVEIRNLHTEAIRCSLWDHPVAVRTIEKWVSWFDARGIDGPGADPGRFRRPATVRLPTPPALRNWLGSMPESLASKSYAGVTSGAVDRLRIAHERAVPDGRRRVRELLEWFGSGEGPWSGFPAWELAPEHLLRDYPFETIVDAIRSGPLSVKQTEGAARLFASWSYQPRFTQQVAGLPSELKSQLWEHVSRSDDPDKRQKAAHAFGVAL